MAKPSTGKVQHVEKGAGGWVVRGEGNVRATSHHGSQKEAAEAARKIASKSGAQVVIHRADGEIRSRVPGRSETVDWAPRTPLGKKLAFLRKRLVESGVPLLSGEEICSEVRRNRGEKE